MKLPALHAAAQTGTHDALMRLLERGADVNAATDAGNTALMLAAARGQVDAVKTLTERGARTDHRNKFGLGAADWAKWSEREGDLLALLGTPPA